MSDIGKKLEETPPEVLRAFLARELAADPDLERRFHSFLDTSDLDVYELRDEIESKYGYQSAPNFTTYEDRAESHIEKGRYRDAATIYRAIFEAMRDRLHEFDPHRGGFKHDETFQDAITSYATAIREANLPHEEKREYIEYCFDQWLDEHEEGGFTQHFREALWELCTTEDDYHYWQSLLRERLDERLDPDRLYGEKYDEDADTWRRGDLTTHADEEELLDGYTETAWLRGYVELLDRIDEQAELGAILNRHYPASRHLCLRYARLLAEEGEREAAITVAEYGTEAFSWGLNARHSGPWSMLFSSTTRPHSSQTVSPCSSSVWSAPPHSGQAFCVRSWSDSVSLVVTRVCSSVVRGRASDMGVGAVNRGRGGGRWLPVGEGQRIPEAATPNLM